jgi:hypothetical protein
MFNGADLRYNATRILVDSSGISMSVLKGADLSTGVNTFSITPSGISLNGTLSGTAISDYLNSFLPTYLTTYATQSFVNTAISNLVNAAPTTLDTLKELATALNNDASFSTTITTLIGTKQPLITSTTDLTYRSLTLTADLACKTITPTAISLNYGGSIASVDSTGVALLYNGVGLRVNTDGVSLTGYQKLLLAFHL